MVSVLHDNPTTKESLHADKAVVISKSMEYSPTTKSLGSDQYVRTGIPVLVIIPTPAIT